MAIITGKKHQAAKTGGDDLKNRVVLVTVIKK